MFFIKKHLILILVIIFFGGCSTLKKANSDSDSTNIVFLGNSSILFELNGMKIEYSFDNVKHIEHGFYYDKRHKGDIIFDDFRLAKGKMLYVYIMNYKLCVYDDNIISKNMFEGCNFVYIKNSKDNFYFDLDENISAIFCNEKLTLSNTFLEEVYINWIDIYTVNDDKKIIINLDGDYNVSEF